MADGGIAYCLEGAGALPRLQSVVARRRQVEPLEAVSAPLGGGVAMGGQRLFATLGPEVHPPGEAVGRVAVAILRHHGDGELLAHRHFGRATQAQAGGLGADDAHPGLLRQRHVLTGAVGVHQHPELVAFLAECL